MTAAAPDLAIITLCSTAREMHLRRQLAASARTGAARRIVVWLDDGPVPDLGPVTVCSLPPGPDGFRLAAGRNLGADLAIAGGADLLIFLDADCIPGPSLVRRYRDAALAHPSAVLCGPVTYLPPGAAVDTDEELLAAINPHPARPAPPPDTTVAADPEDHRLFWSLSFAVSAETWLRTGGFDEAYEGYGAEDTDFAWRFRAAGLPLVWVGGADAFHQYHPTSSPPWQHLADIVRNANLFHQRWREWPMPGWLDAFRAAGAVDLVGDHYVITSRD